MTGNETRVIERVERQLRRELHVTRSHTQRFRVLRRWYRSTRTTVTRSNFVRGKILKLAREALIMTWRCHAAGMKFVAWSDAMLSCLTKWRRAGLSLAVCVNPLRRVIHSRHFYSLCYDKWTRRSYIGPNGSFHIKGSRSSSGWRKILCFL